MQLKFTVEKYDRMGGEYSIIVIEGDSLRSCLLQAFDTLGLYSTGEEIIEAEVCELERRFTDKELLDKIIEESGDGSDYIYSIINLDNNETLYDSGEGVSGVTITSEYNNEPSFEEEAQQYNYE